MNADEPTEPPEPAPAPLRPAVFLDRDGTLMEEVHYCADPALVRLFPGTVDALRELRKAGFLLVIITNQSGIGRGLITVEQYEAVHAELLRQLGHPQAPLIDGTWHCPDAPPTPSPRRKPGPGMVLEAAEALGIDLSASWFIGDKAADVECGRRAGTRTVLVETGYGKSENAAKPDFLTKDIVGATRIILEHCDATRR